MNLMYDRVKLENYLAPHHPVIDSAHHCRQIVIQLFVSARYNLHSIFAHELEFLCWVDFTLVEDRERSIAEEFNTDFGRSSQGDGLLVLLLRCAGRHGCY